MWERRTNTLSPHSAACHALPVRTPELNRKWTNARGLSRTSGCSTVNSRPPHPLTQSQVSTLWDSVEREHTLVGAQWPIFFSHTLLFSPLPPPRLSHYTLSLYRPVVAVGFDVPAPPPCPQPPPCPPRRVHGTSTGPSITRPLGIGCVKWPGAGVAVVAEVTYPRRKVIRTFFFLFWFFAASWKFAGVYPPTEGGRFVCSSFLLGLFKSSWSYNTTTHVRYSCPFFPSPPWKFVKLTPVWRSFLSLYIFWGCVRVASDVCTERG